MKHTKIYYQWIPLLMILVIIISISGCDKSKAGKLRYKVQFTTQALKQKKTDQDTTYSQFGTLITTITPQSFKVGLKMFMILDNWDQSGHSLDYLNQHYTVVDFSNNQVVEFTPTLGSTDLRNGIFDVSEVTFKYLYFFGYDIEQVFEIPNEYGDPDDPNNELRNQGGFTFYKDDFSGKHMCSSGGLPFYEKLYSLPYLVPAFWSFGNTDSTYLFNETAAVLPVSEDNPISGGSQCVARAKFTPVTVKMPVSDQTIEMYTTISFNVENLIQVYTGNDGIPYTMDDVFVYAPRYWERLKAQLEVN